MLRFQFEFSCPKCRSRFYGSTSAGSDMKGHCHGEVMTGDGYLSRCSFTWPRSEDWKYFRLIAYPFASDAEYQEARDRYL